MIRSLICAAMAVALALPAFADVKPCPRSFRTQEIATAGATIHVRVGGTGPAVVLIHGFGCPDAERLVKGRERIYLDRSWNEFAGDRRKVDEASRRDDASIGVRGFVDAKN